MRFSYGPARYDDYPEWYRDWQRRWVAAQQQAPFVLTAAQRLILDDPAPEFEQGDAAFLRSLGIDPEAA